MAAPVPGDLYPMLQKMRELFHYLKWALLVIIVMFIWWAFNPPGGTNSRSSRGDWAARVNGEEIPAATFHGLARQFDRTYQSILGDQYAQQREFIRIGRQAIDSLVEQELIYQEAIAQGLSVTLTELASAIYTDPSLQENGIFIGVERYRDLYRRFPGGVEGRESQLRRELLINKFKNMIQDGVPISEDDVVQEFLNRRERSSVDYVVVSAGDLESGPAPDDAELARYYERHLDRYTQGEGRSGIYVLFSPAEFVGSIEISEEEVRSSYDRALSTRFSLPEQRRASHILLKTGPDATPEETGAIESRAREILERARAGGDFAQLARDNSEDGSAGAGGDLNFFSRGQMVKEFEDAAFSLQVGEISDLVKSVYGFHIIKVTDAREPRTVPFDEVRDQLIQEIKLARARNEVFERSADFSRAALGGALETVARSQGLTVSETGVVRAGDALPGLAASQMVVTRMMSLGEGEVSQPIGVSSGQVIVQVSGILPPEPSPFDRIRNEVDEDYREDRDRARIEEAVAAARIDGGRIADVARRLNGEVQSADDLARGASLPGVPSTPAIARRVRAMSVGEISKPIATPTGFVVLNLRERNDHLDEFESERDSIRDGLERQRGDRLFRALIRRLRLQGDVETNDILVASVDRS